MRCARHIFPILIYNTSYDYFYIIAIWLHNFNSLSYRKLVALLDRIQALGITFPNNAKISIFLNVGVAIIDLCLLRRLSKEKSCGKLALSTI